MRRFILCVILYNIALIGYTQIGLNRNQLILMEYSIEHAHIDSQAVQAFNLDTNEINTVDSLIISIVDYYNVQVIRGSLSAEEKLKLDSLSALQGDFQQVHKGKLKYRKRRMAQLPIARQKEIMTFGENRDSIYKIMMKLYTKSMRDTQQKVVQYAGMGRDTIDLPNYARQYMPYKNQKKERMVYTVCSRDYNHLKEDGSIGFNVAITDLKNEFMRCGDCYEGLIFIKINLDKKTVIRFYTN